MRKKLFAFRVSDDLVKKIEEARLKFVEKMSGMKLGKQEFALYLIRRGLEREEGVDGKISHK